MNVDVFVVVGLALLAWTGYKRAWLMYTMRRWRELASDLGLELRESDGTVRMSGRIDKTSVQITIAAKRGLRVTARPEPAIPLDVVASADTIQGSSAAALAAMTDATVGLLEADPALSVRNSEVRYEKDWVAIRRPQVEQTLSTVLELARQLSVPSAEVDERLATDAAEAVRAERRWVCLNALIERRPPGLGAAVEHGLSDPAAEVRLLSSRASESQRAIRVLYALSTTESEAGAGALEALAGRLPPAEYSTALLRAARQGRGQALVVALRGLREHPEGLSPTDLESVGLTRLDHDDDAVRAEAARLLGRWGTVRAVEPLHPLSRGEDAGPLLKGAARQAVAAIQSRLEDAEAGGLSLVGAEHPSGRVSLQDDGGAVTLVSEGEPATGSPSVQDIE